MNNPKAGWSQEMTLSAPGTNCTLPQLVWLEGQLWCIWCQNDTLYGCSLADGGGSFTQPVPLEFEKAEHYYLLNYSTNDPMEKTNFKFHRIPGILDLNLNLPLVNKYMTLPEYTPAPPPSPWESAEVNTSLPRNASRDAANLPPHSLAPSQTSLPAPIRQTYGYKPFEQSLLKEMERQEEHSYTIISKLEDHLKYHEEAMTAMKDLEAQLQQNHAKLHILQQDMEQLQRVMKEFNNRGFLQRILPSLNKNRADKI